ncbi:sec-independent protein translocase protein TatC [Cyanobacterium sp. HL-69]|uniref:twin-arginine translocase subunit TatC n=1 Tax=Cyanobacterium sp. HL-69 TaxID=2054282 RepID=UPI000CA34AB2|nr:sec-independent protein translocase protein TatC [Cyanobacterium sp. HL-69]
MATKESATVNVEENQDYWEQIPQPAEMSFFDHLEELRTRLFIGLISVLVSAIACFAFVRPIVGWLEIPAQGVKFLQLAPGEFFFVSFQVAGYTGILLASPILIYQVVQFVVPGLTRKERKLLAPVVFGSSILFFAGLAFAYYLLIPAALNFFISYGGDVVEQSWSIDNYFKFVLLLMFCTGITFQIPVIQLLLGQLNLVSSQQMLSGWRIVILGAVIIGAIVTPSTDPLTQSLLGGAVLALYFGGIAAVKLIGK